MSRIRSRILIVEENPSLRASIREAMHEGSACIEAGTKEEALSRLSEDVDVILCPPTLVKDVAAHPHAQDVSIILLTDPLEKDKAQQLVKSMAYDYFLIPPDLQKLAVAVDKGAERAHLKKELRRLTAEEKVGFDFSHIVAESRAMRGVLGMVRKAAPLKSPVLVTGESGTGKELVARAIHYSSPRAHYPFVPVNCGAIPPTLIESELFGHRKGAFTGAVSDKKGLFVEAHKGSLLLDEIGEMPLDLQPTLLRSIEGEEVRPVGSSESIKLDIRFIASSNKDLSEEVKKGRFREDLFYRLNVFPIHIPPLRERVEDIEAMAFRYAQKYARENNKRVRGFSPEAMTMLKNHPWPGNVRELENALQQSILLLPKTKEYIEEADLPIALEKRSSERKRRFFREAVGTKLSIEEYAKAFVQQFEGEHTEKELANLLGITPKTLWEKRKLWGLPRKKIDYKK